jgi:hypothetical protein
MKIYKISIVVFILAIILVWLYVKGVPNSNIQIVTLNPSAGHIGDTIVVTGSGFSHNANKVLFGDYLESDLVSSDGKSLKFLIGRSLGPNCKKGIPCPNFGLNTAPGTYKVSIENENGARSNFLDLTVLK